MVVVMWMDWARSDVTLMRFYEHVYSNHMCNVVRNPPWL